jgi:hypothetical protein
MKRSRLASECKRKGFYSDKNCVLSKSDGVCYSHKVFDSGSIPLVPPQGSPRTFGSPQAGSWVWTLRNESRRRVVVKGPGAGLTLRKKVQAGLSSLAIFAGTVDPHRVSYSN